MNSDGVHQAISAYFIRIFIEVFNSKLCFWAHKERRLPKVMTGHHTQRLIQRRDDACGADSCQFRSIEIFGGQEVQEMNTQLIGRVMTVGVQTPSMFEMFVLEKANRDVRVANVNGEEH